MVEGGFFGTLASSSFTEALKERESTEAIQAA